MVLSPRQSPDTRENQPAAVASLPQPRVTVSLHLVLAVVIGILAAWLAAGSLGLWDDPLRMTTVAVALLMMMVLAGPLSTGLPLTGPPSGLPRYGNPLAWLALGILVLIPLVIPVADLYLLMLVVAVLSLLTARASGQKRAVLRTVTLAVFSISKAYNR